VSPGRTPETDRRPRILVVDDERDNRELMAIVLRWEGFVVATASTGAQALAMIAEHPPDLVLLDIMMPGMTGYEVVTTLKGDRATRHIPVIMVTALEGEGTRDLAMSAGADHFLAKPIVRGDLVASVRTVLREAAGPGDGRAPLST
jgi:CheY-like chemotaxis protein